MSSSRLAWVCAVLLLAAAFALGCSGAAPTTTAGMPSTTAGSSSTITTARPIAATLGPGDRREELYRGWSPAEIIPEADRRAMTDAIASHGLHMLFPSAAPLAGIVEPISAQFHLYRTPATGLVDLWVRVEPADHGFDLTLQSCTDYEWTAGWGLDEIQGATDVTVRGLPGRSYPATDQSLPMIYWQEGDQHYVAAYRGLSVELDERQVIEWLSSWQMLP
jgi:hypothetical protein